MPKLKIVNNGVEMQEAEEKYPEEEWAMYHG